MLLIQSGYFNKLHGALHGRITNVKQIGRSFQDIFVFLDKNQALNKDVLAILIPELNESTGNHWLLGLINFQKKKICVLDGLHRNPKALQNHFRTLLSFVILACFAAQVSISVKEWILEISNDCPTQGLMSNDCGVFTLYYLHGLLTGRPTVAPETSLEGRKWALYLHSMKLDSQKKARSKYHIKKDISKAKKECFDLRIIPLKCEYAETEKQTSAWLKRYIVPEKSYCNEYTCKGFEKKHSF